jgi:hypothetical protein
VRDAVSGVLSFLKEDNNRANAFLEKVFEDQKRLVEIINGLTVVVRILPCSDS